jgi:FtsP/CotA-like multicopper oxidase with cupredoxin domain
MLRLNRSRLRWIAVFALASATAGVLAAPPAGSAAALPAGLECLSSSSNAFSLTASGGYVSTPDGNSLYMWSYGPSGGSFQLPGPTMCVDSGTKVTLVLHNALSEATSIMFPGQTQGGAPGRPPRRGEQPGRLGLRSRP